MLKFNVTGDRLFLKIEEGRDNLNSGSRGYYTAELTFDSDWDGLIPHITITENGTPRADEVIIGNRFEIATTENGIMQIGVYGLDSNGKKCISSNFVCIEVSPGAYTGVEPLSKNIWDEYQIIVLGYMERAEGAALDAKASADNAAESEENAKASEEAVAENKTATEQLTNRAETAAENAEGSEQNASASQKSAEQALSDLLAMINSGDIILATDGKLPLSAIPATATQEIYVVESEDQLTSLTAQRGDLAELVEEIDGEKTITKTWQCLGDASLHDSWVVWGTSYAVQAGNSTTANNAQNANMINNHRIVEMTEEEFASAVKDEDTYYLVY